MPQNYRREIDGLRAVAVVPVILFHAGFQAFRGGFVGVDIFFVISGYLITSLIVAEQHAGTFTLLGFYERRARRILPALFVVMFACLPFAWFWLFPRDMRDFSDSLIAVSGFASNVWLWTHNGYFDVAAEQKPLLHTWSLGVEEQYYLLFPLFLIGTRTLTRRLTVLLLAVAAMVSLAVAQWGSIARPNGAFYLLPTRGWELLIGALLAFYRPTDRVIDDRSLVDEVGSAIGAVLIAYAILSFNTTTPTPSIYTLIPTIGAALVIMCATPRSFVGQLLGGRLFVGVGLISYSAYLWHQPLFAFARHRSIDEPVAWLWVALAATALVLAFITWKYVETPFRNRHRVSRRQVVAVAALCTAILMTVGSIGHATQGFPSRFSDIQLDVFDALNGTPGNPRYADCIRPVSSRSPANACVFGSQRRVTAAIVGDSHADALTYTLGQAFEKRNAGVKELAYAGCPLVFDKFLVTRTLGNQPLETY